MISCSLIMILRHRLLDILAFFHELQGAKLIMRFQDSDDPYGIYWSPDINILFILAYRHTTSTKKESQVSPIHFFLQYTRCNVRVITLFVK